MNQTASRSISRLPMAPGVYRFRDAAGQVLYIGRAGTLRRRVASYWSDLRDRGHLAPMVAQISRIEAVACDSAHEAAWLERNLLETSLPPWNRTMGGQEIPVYIRLDSLSSRPGLAVVHVRSGPATAVYFGPYLGGRRVRQAVKGLNRSMPLAYTAAALSGTQLDIARARGVTGADRAYFIATISAVLRRETEAVGQVRAQLQQLRDHAAGVLAFELASHINQEITALEWVTSPQRATSMAAADFTASGWSGGILTTFVARRGHVREWIQSRCPESDAAPRLAGTRPDWADFARRSAELAAALHQGLLSGSRRGKGVVAPQPARHARSSNRHAQGWKSLVCHHFTPSGCPPGGAHIGPHHCRRVRGRGLCGGHGGHGGHGDHPGYRSHGPCRRVRARRLNHTAGAGIRPASHRDLTVSLVGPGQLAARPAVPGAAGNG